MVATAEKVDKKAKVLPPAKPAKNPRKEAFEKIQRFIEELDEGPETKIVGYGHNKRPRPEQEFKDWPGRFQEVLTIEVLIKKDFPS